MHIYGYGWDMQLMKKKQEVLHGARFFIITADEVTTIDNGTWVMLYYAEDYGCKSMMCLLEHLEEGATSNNLTWVITKAVSDLNGMSREDIATRFLAFGAGKCF
jgi:hypothetical protein